MMVSAPESGIKRPDYINFCFDRVDALIIYAPNGLLSEAVDQMGEDEMNTFLSQKEVVFSCSRAFGEALLRGIARNETESTMQRSIKRLLFGDD